MNVNKLLAGAVVVAGLMPATAIAQQYPGLYEPVVILMRLAGRNVNKVPNDTAFAFMRMGGNARELSWFFGERNYCCLASEATLDLALHRLALDDDYICI